MTNKAEEIIYTVYYAQTSQLIVFNSMLIPLIRQQKTMNLGSHIHGGMKEA